MWGALLLCVALWLLWLACEFWSEGDPPALHIGDEEGDE